MVVLAFLFVSAALAISEVAPSGQSQSSDVKTVPLRREVVPVTRKGEIVSYKTSYSGLLQMGEPATQEFRVIFDTGSGHVILPSSKCQSETCLMHNQYNMHNS